MEQFTDYLNNDDLIQEVLGTSGKSYLMPSPRYAGHIAIALIREILAPTVFRNAEEEITDIKDLEGVRRVRATPTKFKFGERGRGLLILRAYEVGGRLPQNRTVVSQSLPVRDAFDLNTLVFGDSAMKGTNVLPVKACVQYSDALSAVPYPQAVGSTFHNRGDETGTLWDAQEKRNSPNLFERYYLLPGTFLIQILTSNGRQLPLAGLDHLLLSLGLAGSYGGQTSVTGINVHTHIAGIYASRLESPLSSPYALIRAMRQGSSKACLETTSVPELASGIAETLSGHYQTSATAQEATAHQRKLVEAFEQDAAWLKQQYEDTAIQVSDMFERYFQ